MSEQNVPEGTDFETKIIEIMSKHPKGASNKIFQDAIPSMSLPQLVDCLNILLAKNKIQLLNKGNQLVYMLKDSSSSNKCQGADLEEKVVYDAVERAGNNGVAAKDLKFSCNLPQTQITKILKALESKKLIKSVVSTSKKKVFMLCDLEPSRAVTGGTFYSGQDFESEFVDVLSEQCYKYLLQMKTAADKFSDPVSQRKASSKSSKDICEYINNLKISNVNLSVQDIERILDALTYDGKIEKRVTMLNAHSSKDKTENVYRVVKPLVTSAALMRVPCGVCPVSQECRPGGVISPNTCIYMKEWIEF